ncbi:MAG: hypothetical protein DRJ60_00375 [Thermoprotei archaeon]|nr:MAG: hypothetical protein DRJ60_00375 [Thermoprotei archaeon]
MTRKSTKLIRVPEELYNRLTKIAEEKDLPIWKVVAEALSYYEHYTKKTKEMQKLPRLDKASWYCYKFSASVGSLRENPTEENLALLANTCKQLEERYGIDTKLVLKMASEYVKKRSTQAKIEMNETAKLIVGDIICKFLYEQ